MRLLSYKNPFQAPFLNKSEGHMKSPLQGDSDRPNLFITLLQKSSTLLCNSEKISQLDLLNQDEVHWYADMLCFTKQQAWLGADAETPTVKYLMGEWKLLATKRI